VVEKKADIGILVGLVSGGWSPNFRKGLVLMAEKESDIKKIKELVEMMVANDLVEMEIIDGNNKILLKRPQPQQAAAAPVQIMAPAMAPAAYAMPTAPAAAPAQAAAPAEDTSLIDIKSPIVGTFYSAPSPDSAAYVKVGDDVNAETVVCIVEAMKVMNEIKADCKMKIVKILVENGKPIIAAQDIFVIEKV
jgi:acetyl-CoA carboxylase biotin carboxyl carrier protein